MFEVHIRSRHGRIVGYKFFWAMTVVDFDPTEHCQKCFIGTRLRTIKADMPVNQTFDLMIDEGTYVYFCGVSDPYIWSKNFHFACRVTQSASDRYELPMLNGQKMFLRGAGQVKFDERAAQKLFPEKGRKYLTCRNFQFAAQVFGLRKMEPGKPVAQKLKQLRLDV